MHEVSTKNSNGHTVIKFNPSPITF